MSRLYFTLPPPYSSPLPSPPCSRREQTYAGLFLKDDVPEPTKVLASVFPCPCPAASAPRSHITSLSAYRRRPDGSASSWRPSSAAARRATPAWRCAHTPLVLDLSTSTLLTPLSLSLSPSLLLLPADGPAALRVGGGTGHEAVAGLARPAHVDGAHRQVSTGGYFTCIPLSASDALLHAPLNPHSNKRVVFPEGPLLRGLLQPEAAALAAMEAVAGVGGPEALWGRLAELRAGRGGLGLGGGLGEGVGSVERGQYVAVKVVGGKGHTLRALPLAVLSLREAAALRLPGLATAADLAGALL